MEFSWLVIGVTVAANLACIALMYLSQVLDTSLSSRHSLIPGTRQKFLYMQDFWTMTFGDMLGVSMIAIAFTHLAVNGYIDLWQWIAFVALSIVSAVIFAQMCLSKDHKPDMGFPDIGKISWLGILHLPYFGVGIAISIICIWNLVTGNLRGPVMWIGLAGGMFYIACFIAEIKSGNFDPLKKV